MIRFSSLSLLFIFLFSHFLTAQTYNEKRQEILNKQTNTRAEINVLDARIKTYQVRIEQTENKFTESYRQFDNLNRLISLQDDKITNLVREQKQIIEEINLTEGEILLREKELSQLKEKLRDILLYTYKNGRNSNLELIVTASSINQMIVRSYYLLKLEEQKKKQAQQISVRQIELEDVKENLEESMLKNDRILGEIRAGKVELSSQQSIQRNNVERIRAENTDLKTELRKYRLQRENLETSFASLISEEDELRKAENERIRRLTAARNIADAARRAEEIAKYSKPTLTSFVSDETLAAYERNFAASKGNLTWPVNSTTVSKKFGITRNPIYGTRTEHPGINIVTDPSSDVHVVADGYVFAVQPMPGIGNVVLVKHGSYFTAYGNLSKINIQNSSIVQTGQVIGESGTENSELGEVIFFMVRKNSTFLNPEEWLTQN
jgi:septal ring factor EnvC (AmiA/AmiB activator)